MKTKEKIKSKRTPYSFYTTISVFNTSISLTTLVILVAFPFRNDIDSKSTFNFGFIKIAKELNLAGFAQITGVYI